MKKIFLFLIVSFILFLTGCTASFKESFYSLYNESNDIQLIYSNRYSFDVIDGDNDFIVSEIKRDIFNETFTINLYLNEYILKNEYKEKYKLSTDKIDEIMSFKLNNIKELKENISNFIINCNEEISNAEYSESALLFHINVSDNNYMKIYATGVVAVCYNDRILFYRLDEQNWNLFIDSFKSYISKEACNQYGCVLNIDDYINNLK